MNCHKIKMYAVVGFIIAGEMLKGEKININEPMGAITFLSTHSAKEDAEKSKKEHEILNEKSNIKFNFLILKQKSIVLLNLEENSLKEVVNNEPINENIQKDLTKIEKIAESFTNLLHSLGVKKYSTNMLEQSDASIITRKKEMNNFLNENKEILLDLKNYYLDLISKQGNQRSINQLIEHLDNVDENGIPKCLTDKYVY